MNNLDRAHEIRKFEIELYWRRSAYFWTFIALAFTGYGALQVSDPDKVEGLDFLVTNLGFVASFAWFLTNKGSKYWQEVWETHVDRRERLETDPLHKTVVARINEGSWLKRLIVGTPGLSSCREDPRCLPVPSVSKINQIGSLYVVGIWFVLGVKSVPKPRWSAIVNREWHAIDWCAVVSIMFTILTISAFLTWGRSKSDGYQFRRSIRDVKNCGSD